MPPRPVAWHHLWVGDAHHGSAWLTPAQEHFQALRDAEFDGDVHVGLVGGETQARAARLWLTANAPDATVSVWAQEGFEMVTLNVMQQWAKRKDVDPATPVLYTHGKGSFNDDTANAAWRRNMTQRLIGFKNSANWRECVKSLHDHDAVGCHWLSREEYPDKINQPGIFGGNYWWATAGYIARLPPIGWSSRYCAEGWVGLNDPKVKCLVAGWPSYW